ncbi:unknown protein [Seminavis robusta]|uniref:G-protein coupled receptors family 2 profile 2 domain-containing protein n=1 Tax=Seminavis robusta TaxID=568900 RepID=A0A9N8HMK7_9STRA|nr:unknown protein [Seminavis robusta]|eukprot:Sro1127_g244150.1 n/a (417) ;mRNA; f:4803-6149
MVSSMQRKVLAILPKCTGGLSLVGSSCIVYDLVQQIRSKPSGSANSFQRIMLGLSCFDMICSFCNVLSTWPSPEDSGTFMAVGNTQTCTAQGFFNELGNLGAVTYSASLSLQYVWQMTSPGLRNRLPPQHEVWLHIVPITLAVIMAVLGLPLTLYNNSGWICWYAPYPKGCQGDECTRGQLAGLFRWIHYAIVWGAIFTVTVSMYLIFRVVRSTEKRANMIRSATSTVRSSGHSGDFMDEAKTSVSVHNSNSTSSSSPRTKRVATQAFLYIGGLYLTWIFTTLTRIFQTAQGVTHLELLILMALFFPMQGCFNALIYFRSQRNRNQHNSRFSATSRAAKTTQFKSSASQAQQPFSVVPPMSVASSCDDGDEDDDDEEFGEELGQPTFHNNTHESREMTLPDGQEGSNELPGNDETE